LEIDRAGDSNLRIAILLQEIATVRATPVQKPGVIGKSRREKDD
jgi:hypothetical protein